MGPATLARYRITFSKTEAMRFTGHLDLHRTWERTVRRAGLPLAYSEGYNPHPRINLGAALPLGCLSRADLMDAWLEAELDPAEVEAALRQATPPGIEVEAVGRRDLAEPPLQAQISASIYEVRSTDFPDSRDLAVRIDRLLAAQELPRHRRGKDYDLRPLIDSLVVEANGSTLRMQLAAREGAVGRPEEVLQALDLDPTTAIATRISLLFAVPAASQA